MEQQWLSAFDEPKLKAELGRCGIKSLHALSISSFLLAHGEAEAHEVPNLPKAAYPLLLSKFKSTTSSLKTVQTSAGGSTSKLLICLQNGQTVEAVVMRHDATAGAMGLKGNLSSWEIVEQLVHAARITPIRNVVFMGMGEPLNNYDSVVQAVRTMTGSCFTLSPGHVTVSTVGIIPRMLQLAGDLPGVNLALSLHAPTQELRCQIVPVARAYRLPKLMAALDSYTTLSKRKVFIEYIMIGGINDTEEIAHQLGALLQCRPVVVNLIPYNPTNTISNYKASQKDSVLLFQKIIREVYNVRAIVRREMGQDISGACGQLAIQGEQKSIKETLPSDLIPEPETRDIEEFFRVPANRH